MATNPPQPHSALHDRRTLLRIGGVSLAASALELFGQSAAGRAETHPGTADSVLFLWLPGGVTHHESFDPKPDAPAEIRGEIRPISTNVPGVQFAEVLPRLARHMDKLALVRSFAAGTNDHFDAQAYALSGRNSLPGGMLSEPNFGSIIHHQRGATGGLPGYIAVPGSTRPGPPNTNLFVPAWLGQQYAPFATAGEPRNKDFQVSNLGFDEGMTPDRLQKRASLRSQLERQLLAAEKGQLMDSLEQLHGRAVEMLTSPRVRRAFALENEPAAVRENYGMSKIGQRCLLARRLIDAGARFVMVDYGYDWGEYNNLWDNHCAPVQNQPHISKMVKLPYHLPAVDQAFAAVLDDLASSGRLARTLVVYLTEFGRTPKINKEGGRDHWGYAGSIFYAGGGVRGGQVLGATDKVGGYCTTRTYSPADAVATVYRAVGIDPHTTIVDRQNRPLAIQTAGEAIPVF
jgi:Protein of unknown function (DUF1501)